MALSQHQPDEQGVERQTFSHMAIAIDDESTREVDDAIHVAAREGGGWQLYVHVADPTALVRRGSALELEAMTRCAALFARLGPSQCQVGNMQMTSGFWRCVWMLLVLDTLLAAATTATSIAVSACVLSTALHSCAVRVLRHSVCSCRARTLYLPWTAVRMFPRRIAEETFSLAGGEPCRALTFIADIDADGSLSSYNIVPSRINAVRASYSDVDALLKDGKQPAALDALGDDALTMLKVCASCIVLAHAACSPVYPAPVRTAASKFMKSFGATRCRVHLHASSAALPRLSKSQAAVLAGILIAHHCSRSSCSAGRICLLQSSTRP